MKFAYENLSSEQFELLVIAICQFVLGAGVQGFAAGIDGGRDAKFVGTAELHPSKADPWKGTVIVQAKHTNGFNKKFTDSDFFSNNGTTNVIAAEIPRIIKLRKTKALDHYMLFSNRHLTGNGETSIRNHISSQCNIPPQSTYLCGTEQIELWLKRFPDAATIAGIDPIDSPLLVSPEELAEVVEAFAKQLPGAAAAIDDAPGPRLHYEQKNAINNLTPDYAKTLRRRYLKETQQIKDFLANPENALFLRLYLSAVEEFQLNVMAKRREYQTFDDVLIYLLNLLYGRDAILRRNRKLTAAILFYMYWNCDIGVVPDA